MQNAGTEVSTEWVLAHMEDADFNDPLPEPAAAGSAPTAEADSGADAESVALLSSMGFTDAQAAAALKVRHCPFSRLNAQGEANCDGTIKHVCLGAECDAQACQGSPEVHGQEPGNQPLRHAEGISFVWTLTFT